MFLYSNKIRLLLTLPLLLASAAAQCADDDNWRFSGFATVGASDSSHDELAFRSSYLNKPRKHFNVFTDTMVGFQFNYHFSNDLDLVVQAIAQDRGDSEVANYFEMAFLRYQFDRNWSARVGRMNYNAYLLSEYRNVSYAYPWVRPPVDFYLPTSSVSYVDGAEIQYRHNANDGVWQHTFAAGKSESNLFALDSFTTIYYDYVLNATTTYEAYDWLVKVTGSYFMGDRTRISGGDFEGFYDSLLAVPDVLWPGVDEVYDHLHMDNEPIWYLSLGYQYNNDEWLVMAEMVAMDSAWTLLSPYVSGYISLGYRFGDFLPYITLAGIEETESSRQLPVPDFSKATDAETAQYLGLLSFASQEISNAISQSQRSVGVGVRWDVSPSSAIKFQYDHYWIDVPGYALWGVSLYQQVSGDHMSNVVSLTYSTTF